MTDNSLVDAIIVHAREHFPEGSVHVHWDNAEDRWALLVSSEGMTNRWTASSLDGLLTKAENLPEYEDEHDEWEMKHVHES